MFEENLGNIDGTFPTQPGYAKVQVVHNRGGETHGADRTHVNGRMAARCGKSVEATESLPRRLRLRSWQVRLQGFTIDLEIVELRRGDIILICR